MPKPKKQEPEIHHGTISKPPPPRTAVDWPKTQTTVEKVKGHSRHG